MWSYSENGCAMYFPLHRKTLLCTREAVKIMEDDKESLYSDIKPQRSDHKFAFTIKQNDDRSAYTSV